MFEYWAHEACLHADRGLAALPGRDEPGDRPWYGDVTRAASGAGRTTCSRRLRERGPLGRATSAATGGGRDVELEAGEAGARGAVELRPPRVAGRGVASSGATTSRSGWCRGKCSRRGCRMRTSRAARVRSARSEDSRRAGRDPESWSTGGSRAASKRMRPHLDALVAEGAVERVAVEDGGAPIDVARGSRARPASGERRPSALAVRQPALGQAVRERVLGFEHVIEVYKRAHERRYGYYVLPLLWRDRIVGRARPEGRAGREARSSSRRCHRESGVRRSSALDDALEQALERLRARSGWRRWCDEVVTPEEARRIAVRAPRLGGAAKSVLARARASETSSSTRRAVERSQLLVLWSRLGAYDPAGLDRLHVEGAGARRVGRAHLADRGLLQRRGACVGGDGRQATRVEETRAASGWPAERRVRARTCSARSRGTARCARASSRTTRRGVSGETWLVRSARSSLMLEILWGQGKVPSSAAETGERVWDLGERCRTRRRDGSMARGSSAPGRGQRVRRARRAPLESQGLAGESRRALRGGARPGDARCSPFDRLDLRPGACRGAVGFGHRLEMYVPKAKREYGYFVMPVVVGDQIAGRMEPRFDRKRKTGRARSAPGGTRPAGRERSRAWRALVGSERDRAPLNVPRPRRP